MNRAVLPLLILAAVALAVGAAWFVLDRGFPNRGGGLTATDRPLAPFTKIAVDGLADVTLVQGAAESVSVEAPVKQLPHVRAEVRDGTLFIANEDSRNWWGFLFGGGPRSARVTVTFRELTGVRAAGAVKLKADGLKTDKLAVTVTGATSLKIAGLEAKELSIAGSGAVKAEIAGRATEQKIAISGAGDYRAANLVSERASVAVSGAGKVVINATETLKIGISGAGSVDYLGNPQVSEQISGAGRVKRRESAAPGQPSIG
jgi:hypothetical protein